MYVNESPIHYKIEQHPYSKQQKLSSHYLPSTVRRKLFKYISSKLYGLRKN